MQRLLALALGAVVVIALVAAGPRPGSGAQEENPGATAAAVLIDRDGATVGTALLNEQADGTVEVLVDAVGLEPGEHGIHAHETGACDLGTDPAFSSAGGHFNPTGAEHGDHAGDLGNITADEDGRARLEETTDRFTLVSGATPLLDADGAAIVIHAEEDENDPEGESFGGRIACGVLTTGATGGAVEATASAAETTAAPVAEETAAPVATVPAVETAAPAEATVPAVVETAAPAEETVPAVVETVPPAETVPAVETAPAVGTP